MNKNRFKNRSKRAAMRTKSSHHSSSFIKQIDGVTESVNSVHNLIKAVAALLLTMVGIGLIILYYIA